MNSRFHIIKELSSGGMSQTYLAQDKKQKSSQKCVIKKLKAPNNDSLSLEKIQELFEREAKTLEILGKHAQIPGLIAYYQEENEFYLVQEYIEGHPLIYEMSLGERWQEEQTKIFLQEVLQILEYIHSHNVIHLDVKPANIIRRQHDQKLVLIDFGAVKQVNLKPAENQPIGKTQSSVLTCIGTKGYMPDEQLTGRPNFSSDIYALGMTAIQSLTGILPFQLREDGEGEVSWLNQAEVSDDLAKILTKMVRRYHKKRYQTATEVLKDLTALEDQIDVNQGLDEGCDKEPSHSAAYQIPTTAFSFSDQPMDAFWNDPSHSDHHNPVDIPTAPNPDVASAVEQDKPNAKEENQADTKSKRNRLLFQGGMAVLVTTLLAVGAGFSIREYQRGNHKALLEEIESLKESGKNKECIDRAVAFPERFSVLHDQSTELINSCSGQLVEDAKELAENDQIVSAVTMIRHVPEEAVDVFQEMKSLTQTWHSEVIQRAENQYKQCVTQNGENGFDIAVSWVNAIPEYSPVYSDAQASIKTWSQEWSNNLELLNDAEVSLTNEESLDTAETNIEALNLSAAEANIQTAQNAIDSARDKVSEIRILGEQISEDHLCFDLPEFKSVTRLIDDQTSMIGAFQASINSTRGAMEKNPLNVSGNLAQGVSGVSILAEGGVLRIDHKVDGREGDRWSISMRSSDFDTRVFLISPDGNVIASNDDGGDGYNSYIPSVVLPTTGEYRVRASSFDPPPYGQGQYELIVTKFDG